MGNVPTWRSTKRHDFWLIVIKSQIRRIRAISVGSRPNAVLHGVTSRHESRARIRIIRRKLRIDVTVRPNTLHNRRTFGVMQTEYFRGRRFREAVHRGETRTIRQFGNQRIAFALVFAG